MYMHWSRDSTAHDSASISEHHDGVLYMQSQKKQQRHAIKNSNAPRDKCIYRAHFSPMWANHIGQTLIGSLHQPNVEFQKTIYLAQWFIATAELPVAHVRTHVAADFFFHLLWTFATHVSNAGMFLFLGRIELDPGYTCKSRWPAALHSYTWLPGTQTGPVSLQRGSRSGSMTNRDDHRDEELIGTPFL